MTVPLRAALYLRVSTERQAGMMFPFLTRSVRARSIAFMEGGRLPPRPPARTHAARRGGREGSADHGIEARTAPHARRRPRRTIGGERRSRFCSEMARPGRFELPTF